VVDSSDVHAVKGPEICRGAAAFAGFEVEDARRFRSGSGIAADGGRRGFLNAGQGQGARAENASTREFEEGERAAI